MALTRTTSSGGRSRGRPGRGKSSRPPSRFSKNRFRQRLTISRRVLRLLAISSFARPCAARRIILARATIKYGNVYLLARRSSSPRSCLVRTILYGLFRGKLVPSQSKHSRERAKTENKTLSYLLKIALSNNYWTLNGPRNGLCRTTAETSGNDGVRTGLRCGLRYDSLRKLKHAALSHPPAIPGPAFRPARRPSLLP